MSGSQKQGTRRRVRLSKTISPALRHEPWVYDLALDEDGWVPLSALVSGISGVCRQWARLREADVEAMVAAADKRRYELQRGRIRALYGHTIPQKIEKPPVRPPRRLCHGTAPRFIADIKRLGLLPMARQ